MTPLALCVCCRERPVEPRWRPFCSRRCQMLDLAAWAEGSYRIAADPAPPDDPTAPSPGEPDAG